MQTCVAVNRKKQRSGAQCARLDLDVMHGVFQLFITFHLTLSHMLPSCRSASELSEVLMVLSWATLDCEVCIIIVTVTISFTLQMFAVMECN